MTVKDLVLEHCKGKWFIRRTQESNQTEPIHYIKFTGVTSSPGHEEYLTVTDADWNMGNIRDTWLHDFNGLMRLEFIDGQEEIEKRYKKARAKLELKK